MDKRHWSFKTTLSNKKVIVPVLLLILILVIGTSFALWNLTYRQTGTNVVTSGCFKVEYVNESDAITISDAYPTTDIEGKKMVPYKFTITNKCDRDASYYINLETISSGDKVLDETYLKASLTTTDEEIFLDNLKDEHVNQEKLISYSSKAFKLGEGTLQGNESKTYDLRLWLDEDTPLSENTMNRTYQGKITVLATNISLARTMIAMDATVDGNTATNNTYTQNGKYKLSKISFEDKITTLENITETVDFSQDRNKSVLGHYVKDGDIDTYSLHIQSNGKIEANKDATAYFVYTPVSDETIVFEGIENIDTRNVENMSYMFYNYNGTTLDLSSFDTSNVTDMTGMFYICRRLTSLELGNFDTSNVTNMDFMFCACNSLTSLDLSNFDTGQVTDMSSMFNSCSSLTNLDLSNFDTSNVTNMFCMFSGCSSLTSPDLSNFDTGNVTNMSNMFQNCSSLTNLDLSNFDTSNVTKMTVMFIGCNSLTSLNISNFDTSNVTNMKMMFSECKSLTSLDLSNFDTSKVKDMALMFNKCSSITNLDLSSFDTSNVTDMFGMFSECNSLTSLDLSNFNTSKVKDMTLMFYNCSNLTNITYGNGFTHMNTATTSRMFDNCPANKPTDPSWNGVTF